MTKRSGRRRWLTAGIALVIVASTMAFGMGTASAVHDTGAFELDGNAINNPAVPGDDWDNVCHQVLRSGLFDDQQHDRGDGGRLGRRSPIRTPASSPAAAPRTRRTSTSGRGRTVRVVCPTRTTCCTASRRGTRRADGRGAVLRLGPLRQQRRRPAGLLVLPELGRPRQQQRRRRHRLHRRAQGRRPAGDQRLQQRRHDVDDHRVLVGPDLQEDDR